MDLDAQVLFEQVGELLAHHLYGDLELHGDRPLQTIHALHTAETLLRTDDIQDREGDAQRPEDDEDDREPPPRRRRTRGPHRQQHQERGDGREQHDLAFPDVGPVDRDVRGALGVGHEPDRRPLSGGAHAGDHGSERDAREPGEPQRGRTTGT